MRDPPPSKREAIKAPPSGELSLIGVPQRELESVGGSRIRLRELLLPSASLPPPSKREALLPSASLPPPSKREAYYFDKRYDNISSTVFLMPFMCVRSMP